MRLVHIFVDQFMVEGSSRRVYQIRNLYLEPYRTVIDLGNLPGFLHAVIHYSHQTDRSEQLTLIQTPPKKNYYLYKLKSAVRW